jgi:CDP-diglyceride synthetase
MVSIPFLVALLFVSLITGTTIGFGVQWVANQWQLGPLPRAVIGFAIIIPTILMLSIDLGIVRLIPILLVVYYISAYHIGANIGKAAGMDAPEDNDPPDFFFDMMNRYN